MVRFIVAAAFLAASAASADQIPGSDFRTGQWYGAAYTFEESSTFSHCAVSAEYLSGNTLMFSVNTSASVSVGLYNPTFNMVIGDTFPVNLQVDRRANFGGTATAVNPNMAVVSLLDLESALNAFRRGYVLRVRGPGYDQEFNLTGTFRALDDVFKCAVHHYQSRTAARAGGGSLDKTALFQVATAMIAEAGARDFRYLTQVELEAIGLPDLVVWRSDDLSLLGGVGISPGGTVTDLRAESASAIRSLTLSCEGDAASSSRDVAWGDFPAREVRVICREPEGGFEAYRNQMLIDGMLVETLTWFDGTLAPLGDGSAEREKLNEAIGVQAASVAGSLN